MKERKIAVIILAAGKGTRMKSKTSKVLHKLAGRPLIGHLFETLGSLSPHQIITVISSEQSDVAEIASDTTLALQNPPLGTGHAASAALPLLKDTSCQDVLVVFGDTPFLTVETIKRMLEALKGPSDPAVVVLGFRPSNSMEYGRLVTDSNGQLEKIVEAKDASVGILEIDLCNAGIMAFDGARFADLLSAIDNDNATSEYYLTDVVSIARSRGWNCISIETDDPNEVMGINSRVDLAFAEAILQEKLRKAAMENGVTLTDPETVWFCSDTLIGQDVTVGPNVCFGPGVIVEKNVEIRPFCHIEGAKIQAGAVIGPFARLRPGSQIGKSARIGNFVEIKEAVLEEKVKVNHLSYIGDSFVGAGVNIGAGTITCNYDGFSKYKTEIGEGAFIGSNTSLVAPIKIGKGAITGAGSTLSQNIPENSLAVTRAKAAIKPGWANEFRRLKEIENKQDKNKE